MFGKPGVKIGLFLSQSEMYKIDKVTCLSQTVSIIGSVGTDYEQLADSLNPSTALVAVNDIHPLITPENISSCFRDADMMGINDYSASLAYKKDQRVSYLGKYYKALQDNTNHAPTETAYWAEVSIVSEQLTRIVQAATNKMLASVFDKKQINQTVKSIVDDFYLFDGRADSINLNPNLNRLVGFRIIVKNPEDINIVIKKIGAQFSAATGTIPIKLYHSSNAIAPVATADLAYDTAGKVKWFDSTLTMDSVSTLNDTGGVWYLVYNEASIPNMQSTRKDLDLVNSPGCSACDKPYFDMYTKRSSYVDVQPFYVTEGNFTDGQLWDPAKEIHVNENNFGLNFSMTVECDLSDFICRNKNSFANALAYQVAADILQQFCYSSRLNQIKENVSSDAHYALHGDKNTNNKGLMKDLEQKIAAVSFSISELNDICLPCENKKRIHYRTI